MKKKAFSLTELMIVVCVIGVLLAIAIPAYKGVRVRTTETACARNRERFDIAKQMWMIDNGKVPSDDVYFKDLLPEYIEEPPICPLGGQYSLNGLNGTTSCSVHGS